MAQSSSSPHPDLSNGAILHSPQGVCLDTHDAEVQSDDEVELAEEVGEDVLIIAEAEQAEGESKEENKWEEREIIQVMQLSNGEIREGEDEVERLEDEWNLGLEEGDGDQKEIHNQTTEKQCEDTTMMTENLCHCPALAVAEGGNQPVLNTSGDQPDEENEEITASVEMDIRRENMDERTNDEVFDGLVRGTSVGELEVGTHSCTPHPDRTDTPTLSTARNITEFNLSIDVTLVSTGINEQVNTEGNLCQTSGLDGEEVAIQTNQQDNESQNEMKNNGNIDLVKQEAIIDNLMWQNEGIEECLNNVTCSSGDDFPIGGGTNQISQEPELVALTSEEQLDVNVKETRMEEINQKEEAEEQVDTSTEMDGGGNSLEMKGMICVDVAEELLGLEVQEEKFANFEIQAIAVPPEPIEQTVEEMCTNTQHCVDLNQAEEASLLEKEEEVELDKAGGGGKLEENESTTDGERDLQEHHFQLLKEADKIWEYIMKAHPQTEALVEDGKGEGEAEEESMEGEVEMGEEPVSVLNDQTEMKEETNLDEKKGSTITSCSDDAIDKTKDEGYQNRQAEKFELGKENKEIEEDEKEEVKKDVKLKAKNKEVNGSIKRLMQTMENGFLCPEPQALSKDGLGKVKVLSPRRKDNDWIKIDQPEEKTAQETMHWRKELRHIKKEVGDNERGRKQSVSKESSAEEKSPPRKEDWVKELKSVIKDESLPKKRDEQVKKKRVVLLEHGHSYVPQREAMTAEMREEVKSIPNRRAESPLAPVRRNGNTVENQDYEISLYVKVMNHMHNSPSSAVCQ